MSISMFHVLFTTSNRKNGIDVKVRSQLCRVYSSSHNLALVLMFNKSKQRQLFGLIYNF